MSPATPVRSCWGPTELRLFGLIASGSCSSEASKQAFLTPPRSFSAPFPARGRLLDVYLRACCVFFRQSWLHCSCSAEK